MLFALPVGGVNIWPIGRGLPLGNHGCLPVGTSWHTLQIGLHFWSVGVSLTQRNYASAMALLCSHICLVEGCDQGIDAWAYSYQKGLDCGADNVTSLSVGVPPCADDKRCGWR